MLEGQVGEFFAILNKLVKGLRLTGEQRLERWLWILEEEHFRQRGEQ